MSLSVLNKYCCGFFYLAHIFMLSEHGILKPASTAHLLIYHLVFSISSHRCDYRIYIVSSVSQ